MRKAAYGTNLDDKWKEFKWEMEKAYAEARRWLEKDCKLCQFIGQGPVWECTLIMAKVPASL